MSKKKPTTPKRTKASPAKRAAAVANLSVSPLAETMPPGYGRFLADVKSRIHSAQGRAALAVNSELVQLYWTIGRDIAIRQNNEGWGRSIVERLAADLRIAFPGVSGFSAASIWRMRSFFLAWTEVVSPKFPGESARESNLAQPARDLEEATAQPIEATLPHAALEIPWFHNVVLIEKIKDRDERLWYAEQTVDYGWSRAVLVHQIESDLYSRRGKAVNNFQRTLSPLQSDLARELLKDPYHFDFLTLAADAAERELESGLLDHVQKFLLELGAGFAFVGRQVPLEVDGEDYFLDLLFYHLRLRCFIVIDLKTGDFKPEHGGKMNFYLSAVDDRMKHTADQPSIGLILCKTAKKTVAEYALRDLAKPVGVARYVTNLKAKLPKELADALPSIEQLEAALAGGGNGGK